MIATYPFLFISFSCCLASNSGYYWRDYNKIIPQDAITGGVTINGTNIYIGQAYIRKKGLIVAGVNPDEKKIKVTIGKVKKVEKFIKILCGQKENFYWLKTNKTNLQLDIANKHVVIGGHEDGLGDLYVGKITHEDNPQIGKVSSWNINNDLIRWASKETELEAAEYEILIYDTNNLSKTTGFIPYLLKQIFQ